MIKLFFLIIFFLAGPYSLKADEVPGGDQEFKSELNNVKNPFEDGIPKPVVMINKPTLIHHEEPAVVLSLPKPMPEPEHPGPPPGEEVELPVLKLQGVMVGDEMHQAIINDQVVPLFGTIDGAKVLEVRKDGVVLFFEGKKLFLKVD